MMFKPYYLLLLNLIIVKTLSAQNYNPLTDTIVYYLKYPNVQVYKSNEADYFRVVLPPNAKLQQKLFAINEFYANKRIKLLGFSNNPYLDLQFQGCVVEYFENGKRRSITYFNNGKLVDSIAAFYPNGKLYYTGKYDENEKLTVNEYADSTGKIMAEKGNGYWVKYDKSFKHITDESKIVNGLKEGEWHGVVNDSVKYSCTYSKGIVVAGSDPEQFTKIFSAVDTEPRVNGGMDGFYNLLARNLHYPGYAKEHHIQGRVFVTFVVEKDGSLTDMKVIGPKLGGGLEEEAMRLITLSAPWIPGSQNGRTVRVQFTMSVSFSIATDR